MRWLGVVNYFLVGSIFVTAALFFFSNREEEYTPIYVRPEIKELPKSPFADMEEFFQEIDEGVLHLKWVPPQMQLPDLRHELMCYGKNGRPDSVPGKTLFHLCLQGSQEKIFIREREKIYLVYQGNYTPKIFKENKQQNEEHFSSYQPIWGEASPINDNPDKPAYVFSPNNQPTPLWFEVRGISDQSIEVQVSMFDERGMIVHTPNNYRSFPLQFQEIPRGHTAGWEIGGHRADSTLLVRQKARWVGPDLFLEKHGGDEYAHISGTERIDFLEGPKPYSCFIKLGDFLVWKENQWKVIEGAEESQNLPLLVVKKIDDKLLSFELWDLEGRVKVPVNLIRTKDHNPLPNLNQEFKFVGAKTWAQFIVESKNGGRMILKPHDWLVLTQEGWKKLDTPELIDDYVNHALTGPLFILDRMTKQNGQQVLVGHLFNTNRTEMHEVELTSTTALPLANYCRQLPISSPIAINAETMELVREEG